MDAVDCVVIGAGVVGLAIARALAEAGRQVLVLEAAEGIGTGTSSRNSEVIHAGIYYPEGSLKALLCRRGRDLLYDYCTARHVPHARIGKLIVGASEDQRPQLRAIEACARANRVEDLAWIERDTLRTMEPAVGAEFALFSPSTGIVDSHALMLALQGDIEAAGGMVLLHAPVVAGRVRADGIELEIGGRHATAIRATRVVNAAGLDAQRVARAIAGMPAAAIPQAWYAKAHYYAYSGASPFRHLVYPLPEEGGLGVHATLDLGGQAKFGPDVRWTEEPDYLFDDGARDAFVAAIRAYYPALDPARLHPGYTGMRPKLSGPGMAAADFRIDGPGEHGVPGLVNLFGIESPGLTASLAIGELVAGRLGYSPMTLPPPVRLE